MAGWSQKVVKTPLGLGRPIAGDGLALGGKLHAA